VAAELDRLNRKKAPGSDTITTAMLAELPKKGIVMLLSIFNAVLRFQHVPLQMEISKNYYDSQGKKTD